MVKYLGEYFVNNESLKIQFCQIHNICIIQSNMENNINDFIKRHFMDALIPIDQ